MGEMLALHMVNLVGFDSPPEPYMVPQASLGVIPELKVNPKPP